MPTRDPFEIKPMMETSDFNKNQQLESMSKKAKEISAKIAALIVKLEGIQTINLPNMMDLIEEVICSCGGDSKVEYLEVCRDVIRIRSRIPLKAHIYQFMPSNPGEKFHKVVTKILLCLKMVDGVRWIPDEDGSILIVSFIPGTKV